MDTRSQIVLDSALRAMRPLVRWLLRHGVRHQEFVAAMKRLFLEAAQDELAARGMAATDSAVTLLCGVHRRDVRQLTRQAAEAPAPSPRPAPGLVGEVVARWMSDRRYLDRRGRALTLARGGEAGFDALVAGISRDVRPRAMLEEMLRLGVVEASDDGVRLKAEGFAPRQGLAESAGLAADNLHDHTAAIVANLEGEANFLEQAVYVDQLTPESAQSVRAAARAAWLKAMKSVMREATRVYEHDQAHAQPHQRTERARFGVYCYGEPMNPKEKKK